MKKYTSIRKMLVTLLITVMLFNVTGCSDFLRNIAMQKVEDYVMGSMNGFFEHPDETLTANSQAEIVFPDLIEQQSELAHNAISKSAFEISKIKINDKRDKAVVTFTFENCPSFSVEDPMGTVDELEDLIETDTVDVDLTVLRTKDHKWIYEDLNELVEIFYAPFAAPCVLDEEGNPFNINQAYINMIYVDDFWFDPLMNNPITGNSLRDVNYLKCVVYFNRPLSLTCTAELLYNGSVVDTYEVVMDGDVTADCHFTSPVGTFSPGTYSVVLYYNDQEMVTSSTITVS